MIKILLIEDNEDIMDILSYVLVDDGFDVVSSANVLPLKDLEQMMPDLILLDEWIKDNINGSEWCRQVKAHNATSHIPVLMLSAFSPIEHIVKEAGADGYIRKPFDINNFKETIQKYLLVNNGQ